MYVYKQAILSLLVCLYITQAKLYIGMFLVISD